jgi:hypothetical protein
MTGFTVSGAICAAGFSGTVMYTPCDTIGGEYIVQGCGSCVAYGCVDYTPSNACQCDAQCTQAGNCCADYLAECRITGMCSGNTNADEDIACSAGTVAIAAVTTTVGSDDISCCQPADITRYSSILTAGDSAEEEIVGGAVTKTSSDLEFMHDSTEQLVAIRFPSVDVPGAARITSAIMTFDIDEINSGRSDAAIVVAIFGEASINSAPISTNAFDLSSRGVTSAAVVWSPEPSNAVHDVLQTSDISAVVQEIVNLADWVSGSPLTILFAHVSGSGTRWVEPQRTNGGVDTPGIEIKYSVTGK